MITEDELAALLQITQKHSLLKRIFVRHARRMTDACFRLDKKVDVGLKAQPTTVLNLKQFSIFHFQFFIQRTICKMFRINEILYINLI